MTALQNFNLRNQNANNKQNRNFDSYQTSPSRFSRQNQMEDQNNYRGGFSIQRDVRLDQGFRQQNRPNTNQNSDNYNRVERNYVNNNSLRSQYRGSDQFNSNRPNFQYQNQQGRFNQNFSYGSINNGRYERNNNRDFLDKGRLNQKIQQ